MNKSEIQELILSYLNNETGIDTQPEIDTSLVDGGILDSFDIVALTTYLAATFKFKISPLEVNLENFDTVERISAFIDRKTN